jgi:hypothetical protein
MDNLEKVATQDEGKKEETKHNTDMSPPTNN